jgi:hypothetical protein
MTIVRMFAAVAAVMLLSHCGGGGGGSTTSPVVPPPAAPTLELAASPGNVGPATAATLTWSSANATGCTASGGWSGARPAAGSESTGPLAADATYTLVCTGAGGAASRTVGVTVAAAASVNLAVSPAIAQKGATATLTWSSSGAAECVASGAWSGAKAASGSETIGPLTATAAYSLSCRGSGGTAGQTVTVVVNQPPADPAAPTLTLTAAPVTITTGSASTLTWTSADATSCAATGNWSGARPTAGTASTGNLTASSTYVLTCTGPGGSATRTASVIVVTPPPPPNVALSAAPVTSNPGSTQLTWATSNATACVASGAWQGARDAAGGSVTLTGLTTSATYTLTCSGAGGTTTQSLTVFVPPPTPQPTVALTASPASLQQGGASNLAWSSSNATACTASGDWSGARALSGSQSTGTLSTPGNYSYTLTCSGPGGSEAKTSTVTVTATPPAPTVSLDAVPSLVATGGSATLTWSAINATACAAGKGWSGTRPTSGNETINGLAATTTYGLTCTGPGGSTTREVTVTVWTPTAPTVTLTATPASVTQGVASSLTWSSSNASACTASGGWSGSQPTGGTAATAALALSTTYTLTCTGPGGSAAASTTVRVTPSAVGFPLSASAGSRRLVDANGRPFLAVGDAAWSLITALSKVEAIQYLDDRQQRGFNTLVVNLIEHQFNGPVNREGNAPFSKVGGVFDFSQPNAAYFAHADFVIGEAAKRGMLVLLTPAYLGFGGGAEGWWPEINTPLNSDTVMLNYGRFLGDRYKGFNNVLWVMGGDWYDPQTLTKTRLIVQGIRERDPAKVFTAHNARQESALLYYASEPWLGVNTTYSDCASTALRAIEDYQRPRVMPSVYFEGTYENEGGATPQCLRSQAYWPVLLGSSGSVFGNAPMWLFDSGWQAALGSGGAQDMTRFRKLLLSRAWELLVPSLDASVLVSGRGSGTDYAAVALATRSGGAVDSILVYAPTQRAMSVDLSKVGDSTVRAWWFNPATGASTLIGEYAAAGTQTFTPPAAQDWVLVIDNAALGLAAPGL